jgi:hypothetical protein
MSRTTRWHLRNIAIAFIAMYGWAFLTEEEFFVWSNLVTRFAAWILVVAMYGIAVFVFRLEPPPEDEQDSTVDDDG